MSVSREVGVQFLVMIVDVLCEALEGTERNGEVPKKSFCKWYVLEARRVAVVLAGGQTCDASPDLIGSF